MPFLPSAFRGWCLSIWCEGLGWEVGTAEGRRNGAGERRVGAGDGEVRIRHGIAAAGAPGAALGTLASRRCSWERRKGERRVIERAGSRPGFGSVRSSKPKIERSRIVGARVPLLPPTCRDTENGTARAEG